MADLPIGVFDSGLGGLTVVNALRIFLPNESIVYIGDTAHLPYGDKSQELIQYYSLKITDFLLQQPCKVLVIACNTASAYAYQEVKDYVYDHINNMPVVNVIDPVIEYLSTNDAIKKVGVIGTKGTIESGSYQTKINSLKKKLEIAALATPLFVPMIEEAFVYDDISNAIIRAYLSKSSLKGIDSLILGCTHYPIIKNQIRKFFNFGVNVIDSAQLVAMHLKKQMEALAIQARKKSSEDVFYVTDYTESFQQIASMFLEDKITLEKMDLWD